MDATSAQTLLGLLPVDVTWSDLRALMLEHGADEIVRQIEAYLPEGVSEKVYGPRGGLKGIRTRPFTGEEQAKIGLDALIMAASMEITLPLALAEFEQRFGVRFDWS
jgi:hypothetical protein